MVSKDHCADGLYCFASGGGWWLCEVREFKVFREFEEFKDFRDDVL